MHLVSTRSSYSRIITSTVSALYAVIVGQACIQWYYMNFTFVRNGDSRQSLFNLSFSNPSAACVIASNVLGSMGLLLADGLLVRSSLLLCRYVLNVLLYYHHSDVEVLSYVWQLSHNWHIDCVPPIHTRSW